MITRDYSYDKLYANNHVQLRKDEYSIYAKEGWYNVRNKIYTYRSLIVTNLGNVYYNNQQTIILDDDANVLLSLATPPPKHMTNNVILPQNIIYIIQNLPVKTTICVKTCAEIISYKHIVWARDSIISIIESHKHIVMNKKISNTPETMISIKKYADLYISIPKKHRCHRCFKYSKDICRYEPCLHGNICAKCYLKYPCRLCE